MRSCDSQSLGQGRLVEPLPPAAQPLLRLLPQDHLFLGAETLLQVAQCRTRRPRSMLRFEEVPHIVWPQVPQVS